VVAEVDSSQLEEIDDNDDLGENRMAADPQHDPNKLEDIVPATCQRALNCGNRKGLQDKVAADRSSGVLGGFIAFEEMINVDDLENPEHDPVDIDEDGVQSKRSTMAVEDLVASKVAVDGGMVDVVEGGDELQDER